jgi:hypothetical protein
MEQQSLHPLCTLKPYKLLGASLTLLDVSLTTIKITLIYVMYISWPHHLLYANLSDRKWLKSSSRYMILMTLIFIKSGEAEINFECAGLPIMIHTYWMDYCAYLSSHHLNSSQHSVNRKGSS